MKRSSQVALLLGGLTAAGAGAYAVTPPRQECQQPAQPPGPGATPAPSPSGGITVAPGATPAPAAPQATEPCRRNRRWGSWGPSYGSDSRSSRGFWPTSSRTSSPSSTRTNISPTSRSSTRTSTTRTSTTRTSSPSRGGFGSTGRSAGRSSS